MTKDWHFSPLSRNRAGSLTVIDSAAQFKLLCSAQLPRDARGRGGSQKLDDITGGTSPRF